MASCWDDVAMTNSEELDMTIEEVRSSLVGLDGCYYRFLEEPAGGSVDLVVV